VWYSILFGYGFRRFGCSAEDRNHFRVFDARQPIQMFLGKRALPNHADLHCISSFKRNGNIVGL
jgi:hypothetical protein